MSQAISTGCLWYSFTTHMQEAGSTPQPIFKRLSTAIVIRGALLTAIQLVIPIMYLARPDRLWWEALHQILSPLYYTTTVAALNTRYSPTTDSLLPTTRHHLGRSGSYINSPVESVTLTNFPKRIGVEPLSFGPHQRPEERLTPFTQLYPVGSRESEKNRPVLENVEHGLVEGASQPELEVKSIPRYSQVEPLGVELKLLRANEKQKEVETPAVAR
ncbi:hypothetical protein V5O48_013373, partial [Marasmius crinis-equi]